MWELIWNDGITPLTIELIAIFLLPLLLFFKVLRGDIKRMRLNRNIKMLIDRVDITDSKINELNEYIHIMHKYIQERL